MAAQRQVRTEAVYCASLRTAWHTDAHSGAAEAEPPRIKTCAAVTCYCAAPVHANRAGHAASPAWSRLESTAGIVGLIIDRYWIRIATRSRSGASWLSNSYMDDGAMVKEALSQDDRD